MKSNPFVSTSLSMNPPMRPALWEITGQFLVPRNQRQKEGNIQDLLGLSVIVWLAIRRAMLLVRFGGLVGSGARDELVGHSRLVFILVLYE
jgi:hypothetical protein